MNAAASAELPDTPGFGDALRAELTKLLTLPAPWVALALTIVANVALGVVTASDAVRLSGADGGTPLAHLGTLLLAPVYAFIAIALFAAGSEYHGGQLRVTLTAIPRRGRMFCAKLTAAALCGIIAAPCAVIPGYVTHHAIRADMTAGRTIADVLPWIGVYLALSAIGFGFGFLARGVVVPLAVLFLLPVLMSPTLGARFPQVMRFMPHEASLSLLGIPASPQTSLAPAAAAAVLAAWSAVMLLLALTALIHRDS